MSYGSIVAAAEDVLSQSLDRHIRLGDVTCLSDDERRNLLLRVHDLDEGRPASFIIKKVVADSYDPADLASWDTRLFLSDWAGAELLSTVLSNPRSARFYGGDYAEGFFILEDLGEHRSLVEPLLEQDAARAEKALLVAGQKALGRRFRRAEFYERVEQDLAFRIMRSHFHNGYPKGAYCCVQCTLAVIPVLEAGAIRYFDCRELLRSVTLLVGQRKWRFARAVDSRMVNWALPERAKR